MWLTMIGLDACIYGTHSLRRTKATLMYKRTGNLGAVQLLLGHTKIESTVRYLGIEVDDALAIAEQTDVWNTRAEPTCSARPPTVDLCHNRTGCIRGKRRLPRTPRDRMYARSPAPSRPQSSRRS